jgi:hypothetical protein
VNDFSSGPGIVALAAAGVAVLAMLGVLVLWLRLRRVRQAQKVILGPDRTEDLVDHATRLHQAFEALQAGVQDTSAKLDQRMGIAEHRLDGALAYRALVRYDAYGELSGHQSTTVALLDAEHNGVVLSSIAHRESARLYCKQVVAGEGDVELSPEEAEAVRLALSGELGSRVLETD